MEEVVLWSVMDRAANCCTRNFLLNSLKNERSPVELTDNFGRIGCYLAGLMLIFGWLKYFSVESSPQRYRQIF